MDRNDWNARYAAEELLWGAEPNRFLADEFAAVSPAGRALDIACGEGRNAIWLALRGWTVTAVDFSEVALERARALAARQGVEVEWLLDDVTTYEPAPRAFALVVILYLQVPPPDRRRVLGHAATALAPGGELFMVGHALRNLTEGVGGPRSPDVLWDPESLGADLAALPLDVQRVEEVDRPVESEEGLRMAIDVLARARRK